MTNQNNAAQSAMQETVLTDLEIQEALGAIFVASHPYGRRDVLSQWEWEKAAARAIESALLSKLRATVADERDEPTAPDDDAIAECWVSASDIDGIEYDGPSFERGYRTALTSAPVAGEAVYTLRVRGLSKPGRRPPPHSPFRTASISFSSVPPRPRPVRRCASCFPRTCARCGRAARCKPSWTTIRA